MERKFKVGDTVISISGDPTKIGTIVFIDNRKYSKDVMPEDRNRPFFVDYSNNGTDWTFSKEEELILVKPKKEPHPFTVILKSGVKIGISSTMFDYINEQDNNTTSVQTVEDGTFILSEIAAIVPTENLI